MSDLEKQLFKTLYEEYGSMTVSKKQAAIILGCSTSSLDSDRRECRGIPYLQKTSVSNVSYTLHDLVKHLINDTVKTA